ncbi:MAG: DMT family transporter [Bacteroidota bacterium]
MRISRGILYMMLATLSFAFVGLGAKLLKHIANQEINFFKALVCMLVCYGAARYKQVAVWGSNYRLLLARGITGAVGIILYFITLQQLPLALANTIQYTSPIFTAILGILLLQQPVGVRQWFYSAAAMGGVVIANGSATNVDLRYVLVGLLSALAMGVTNNLNSMLKGKEGPIVIVFYMSLFTALGTGGHLLYDFTMPQWRDVAILVAIGVLTFVTDTLATTAFQLAAPAQVSAVSYLVLPYSLALGYTFLGETYTWINLLGMGFVLLGALSSSFDD